MFFSPTGSIEELTILKMYRGSTKKFFYGFFSSFLGLATSEPYILKILIDPQCHFVYLFTYSMPNVWRHVYTMFTDIFTPCLHTCLHHVYKMFTPCLKTCFHSTWRFVLTMLVNMCRFVYTSGGHVCNMFGDKSRPCCKT